MKRASKTKRAVPAESIARLADNGKDISSYFTNCGKIMPPLESVTIDVNRTVKRADRVRLVPSPYRSLASKAEVEKEEAKERLRNRAKKKA
jgi:queuine/archaeosine tRNA-ribosyltransferase